MVKGTSRQVIVVSNPDRRYFETAIFLLRSDAPSFSPAAHSAAVDEACRIARRCMARRAPRRLPRIGALLWAAAGAAAMALLWFFCGH